MKENVLKGLLTLALAAVWAYFRELAAPLAVLVLVMIADYITGMAEAWAGGTLSSRVGIMGIVKKIGYLFGVAVAVVADWVIRAAGQQAGLALDGFYMFGLLVTVWMILNECISILENISQLGVPLPGFLMKLIGKLKKTTEERGENLSDGEKGKEARGDILSDNDKEGRA